MPVAAWGAPLNAATDRALLSAVRALANHCCCKCWPRNITSSSTSFSQRVPACVRGERCCNRSYLSWGCPTVRDEGELRLSLLDHLLSKDECPTGLLLLVDEAQTLPIALLDELRVLTNLVRGALPRVRLVLAGSSSLEECFADPELESFSQRLAVRCYLGPFNSEETSQFIRAQLVASRATPEDVFSTDALSAVFEATDGVPRLVNQLCDRALADASAAGRAQIDRRGIQVAWADIQQLPTPWETPDVPAATSQSPAIEFGNLTIDTSRDRPVDVLKEDDDECDTTVRVGLIDFDTELDLDDEPVETPAAVQRTEPVRPTSGQSTRTVDPFAEQFDEEEVVLDNFAAWDEMFRHDTPRVANRRDPEFATLVAAAIDAAPANVAPQKGRAANLSFEIDVQNTVGAEKQSESKIASARVENSRPKLRIADVSDMATKQASEAALDDDPVLIVEDDAPMPGPRKPPVRREEYRQLFSRLRSG